MNIDYTKMVKYPTEFKSVLPSHEQANVAWGDYVNNKQSEIDVHFQFERDYERNETLGTNGYYATEKPIWNVKYFDGYDFKVIGCVTAFDDDEVRCTFEDPNADKLYADEPVEEKFTASGSHPFEAFENAVSKYKNK